MAKVYWATRRGELTPTTAARLVYVLSEIAKLHRDCEVEARLVAVERRLL